MTETWTKLKDGEWGIRVDDPSYSPSMYYGIPVVVKTKAGKKSTVLAGDHLKTFRVERGRIVYIFRVMTDEQNEALKVQEAELRARAEA